MSEFKSWEDYTELEQLQISYSEMHKDVYGCRARFHYDWDLERLKAAYDRLCETAAEEFEREVREQKEAAVAFEEQLATLIAHGAGDRETALRWLLDSITESDMDRYYIEHDPGYVRYEFNLPGNYDWKKGEYIDYSKEVA